VENQISNDMVTKTTKVVQKSSVYKRSVQILSSVLQHFMTLCKFSDSNLAAKQTFNCWPLFNTQFFQKPSVQPTKMTAH